MFEGGHDNPIQYYCLENPLDREAWWAIVHRVAQSPTQLRWLSTHAMWCIVILLWLTFCCQYIIFFGQDPWFWHTLPQPITPWICKMNQCLFWNSGCTYNVGLFNSVAQSCPTLCDPMNYSTPGLPVHHQLPEVTQTHVHWVSDATQPSHPPLSPSPPAFSLSQHQGLFQWVSFSHEVAKILESQLQHQSFQWTPRTDLL